MIRPWRPLAIAAVVSAMNVGVATAQTLIVRNAPAASAIEVVREAASLGKATADAAGEARITLTLLANTEQEKVAHFYADRCPNLVRIGLIERDRQPPAPALDCDRREVTGFFVVRRGTSMVLDVGPTTPTLLIRQGPPPQEWVTGTVGAEIAPLGSPSGLNISAGAGLPRFAHTFERSCGTVSPCSAEDFIPAFAVAGSYWVTRNLGAEVSFVKSAKITTKGSGDSFRFGHEIVTDVLTVAGNAGVITGPIRVYGRGGLTYHRANSTIDQTIDERTVTLDDVVYTLTGGRQAMAVDTAGWGWMYGAGLEYWATRRLAFFGEGSLTKIKGADQSGGEADMDERVMLIVGGVRLHLGHLFRKRP